MTAAGAVFIDVIFDTVCPWCYIGKRRLDRALALRPQTPVQVRWRPFLLNPDMPSGGMPRRAYMERKYGSRHRVERIERAITAAGRAEGIAFALDAIARTPDSLMSHRLIRLAERHGLQAEAVEAVFHAFLVAGRDTGDAAELKRIALDLGLPAEEAERIDAPAGWDDLRRETARAQHYGVNGVPCFVFQGRYSLAGAQEPLVLARMIDLARETALLGEVQASL